MCVTALFGVFLATNRMAYQLTFSLTFPEDTIAHVLRVDHT